MSDTLSTLLSDFSRAPETAARATALVEYERDPRTPGRTAYRITGPNPAVVQNAIDARMREAEEAPGPNCAQFEMPRRRNGQWEALGYVEIAVASPPLAPVL